MTTVGTGAATDGRAATALGGEEGHDGAEARADGARTEGPATDPRRANPAPTRRPRRAAPRLAEQQRISPLPTPDDERAQRSIHAERICTAARSREAAGRRRRPRRWPDGKKKGECCLLCSATATNDATGRGKNGFGARRCRPQEQNRCSQGQRSGDEGGGAGSTQPGALIPCHKWRLVVLIEAQRAIYIEYMRHPKP